MAQFLGSIANTAGNFVEDVVSFPGKVLGGGANTAGSNIMDTGATTLILGGKYVEEVHRKIFLSINKVIIVGPAIYAFYKAKGYSIGDTDVSDEDVQLAKEMLQIAEGNGVTIVLPKEVVVSMSPDDSVADVGELLGKVVLASEIPNGRTGQDTMAPSTVDVIGEAIKDSSIIQWNGYYVKGLFKKFAELEDKGATFEVFPPTLKESNYDDITRRGDDIGSVHFGAG